jgi:hypothetical protein
LNTSQKFGQKITIENIVNGGKNTPYPHVYINFCNYGNKSRILPVVDDGSILQKKQDLEVVLTFDEKGAPNNVVFDCGSSPCNRFYNPHLPPPGPPPSPIP